MTAKSALPASSSFGASVEAPGSRISRSMPSIGELALRLGRVDPGVHGVGNEIEHEGRLLRGARFSTVAAAGHQAESERDGRQRRDHS